MAIVAACGTQKDVAIKNEKNNGNDSTEYKLIVFDARFETWYTTHSQPMDYFSESYYESWNSRYVDVWNSGGLAWTNEPINYRRDVDYPVEIDHKLFYYFVYEEKIKDRDILGQSPNVAIP